MVFSALGGEISQGFTANWFRASAAVGPTADATGIGTSVGGTQHFGGASTMELVSIKAPGEDSDAVGESVKRDTPHLLPSHPCYIISANYPQLIFISLFLFLLSSWRTCHLGSSLLNPPRKQSIDSPAVSWNSRLSKQGILDK